MANNKLTGVALFAAGAGIGAALALLYAPRSGKATRWRLWKTANRTLNEIEDVREEVRTHMSEWVDEASETIATSIAGGKESLKEGGEHLKRTIDNVREHMDEGRERVEAYIRSVAG